MKEQRLTNEAGETLTLFQVNTAQFAGDMARVWFLDSEGRLYCRPLGWLQDRGFKRLPEIIDYRKAEIGRTNEDEHREAQADLKRKYGDE